MSPTQRPTFTQQVIGGTGGYVYLPSSGGATPPFDFTTGPLPSGMAFRRASIGTYFNAAGTLITAGNNVPRLNYAGGTYCLLIEGSATNLCLNSNDFTDGSIWYPSNGAVNTPAQFISPDGTNNGWSTTSGNAGFGYQVQYILFTNAPYTLSVWVKQIIGTAPLVIGVGGINSSNITTSATITRYSATQTPSAGTFNVATQVATATPNQSHGIYGVQVESGSKVTSYIPTAATTVTRAADSAVFTVPAGIGHLTYTFDDNSTQSVTVSAGSYTIPVTLNRPNIKSIVGSA